jgi:hypothetical protein
MEPPTTIFWVQKRNGNMWWPWSTRASQIAHMQQAIGNCRSRRLEAASPTIEGSRAGTHPRPRCKSAYSTDRRASNLLRSCRCKAEFRAGLSDGYRSLQPVGLAFRYSATFPTTERSRATALWTFHRSWRASAWSRPSLGPNGGFRTSL